MKKFIQNVALQYEARWKSGCLLWLLCLIQLPQLAHAQTSQRPRDPTDDPTGPCSPIYGQNGNATYVAANHLSGTFGAADIGATGVTTTIDVGLYYGGTVVFSGLYHVRGNVRFANGTVELRPRTAFIVEGLNGQTVPTTTNPDNTVIEVENASLELTGASMQSTCPRAWGGISLLNNGRLRTRPDPAAVAPAGRSAICDAIIGVNVTAPVNGRSTGEYYLNGTDFVNNYIGVFDYFKNVARAGEGAHYCSFSRNAGTKEPIANLAGYAPIGIRLSFSDQGLGSNNYAAASIDHCSFHHLDTGIYGTAQQLRITDNTFDHCWHSALDLDTQSGAGFFSFTPMYVQRNDIMLRGAANPMGAATIWGIKGGVYAQDNYLHGDDANPAGNAVEQVGIWMTDPDNSTQTGNTFERLDKGIEAGVNGTGVQRDMSGNLFRDVQSGINMYAGSGAAMNPDDLFVRCNSFENPGGLVGAVALNIEGPDFPSALGTSSNGNGNRFVTPGLPSIEPIGNNLGLVFDYWRFGSSTQENFSQASANQTYAVRFAGGNPATACTGAGYTNGINNRSAVTRSLVSPMELQNAYDSLRLSGVGSARRHKLMNTLFSVTSQHQDFAGLETYLASLPNATADVYTPLGCWLLATYRTAHRETDAQRVRAALLARRPTDPEVSSFVQLSDVQARLARATDPLAPPAPADVAALRQVAASGTASARVACPVARRYEPACPCRFSARKAGQALVQRGNLLDDKRALLGAPYPNPAGDWMRIPYSLPRGSVGPAHLEVRNALGQLLRAVLLPLDAAETRMQVNQLPAGLYQVTLLVGGRPAATQRFAVTQ